MHALKGPTTGDDIGRASSSTKLPKKRQSEDAEQDNAPSSLLNGGYDSDDNRSDSEFDLDEDLASSARKSSILSDELSEFDDKEEFSFKESILSQEMPAQGKEAMYEAYNQLHTLAQVSERSIHAMHLDCCHILRLSQNFKLRSLKNLVLIHSCKRSIPNHLMHRLW